MYIYKCDLIHLTSHTTTTTKPKPMQKEKKVYDGFKVAVGDTRGFTEYKNGGVLTQVKKPVQYSYRTLRENLAQVRR